MAILGKKSKLKSADFVWQVIRSDLKLLAYPIIHILAIIFILFAMWNHIFNMPVSRVAKDLNNITVVVTKAAVDSYEKKKSSREELTLQKQTKQEVNSLIDHINFKWLAAFIGICILLSIYNFGAMTAQALVCARGEKRSILYCYFMALIRLPQLILWWMINVIISMMIQAIESSDNFISDIIGAILGAFWSVLTFFSITAIVDRGCLPLKAIKSSKSTLKDSCHKIFKDENINLRTIRRGLYIGAPLWILSFITGLMMMALIFVDIRDFTNGDFSVAIGGWAVLLILILINHALRNIIWTIVKAVVYIWAREGKLAKNVEESEVESTFIVRRRR